MDKPRSKNAKPGQGGYDKTLRELIRKTGKLKDSVCLAKVRELNGGIVQGMTIPRPVLRALGWVTHDPLAVEIKGDQMVCRLALPKAAAKKWRETIKRARRAQKKTRTTTGKSRTKSRESASRGSRPKTRSSATRKPAKVVKAPARKSKPRSKPSPAPAEFPEQSAPSQS